jgi:leucine-rich repeat protein SHOC2
MKFISLSILFLFNSLFASASSKVYKSMDEALKNPSAVIKLKLRGLDSLPASIGLLVNLEELDLSKNKLQTLPREIKNLKKLKELILFRNKLTSAPR